MQAIQNLRGVQFTVAIGLIAELGDLSRFDHPRQLMPWLGVTPSEHSTGGTRRLGGITKAGNKNGVGFTSLHKLSEPDPVLTPAV